MGGGRDCGLVRPQDADAGCRMAGNTECSMNLCIVHRVLSFYKRLLGTVEWDLHGTAQSIFIFVDILLLKEVKEACAEPACGLAKRGIRSKRHPQRT
jgi:hypothetical protein